MAKREARIDFHDTSTDLEQLTAGIAPITDLSELRADFWPEDETVDDVLLALRQWCGETLRG